MSIKRITAIVPTEFLPELEKYLRAAGVPGMTINDVRGFGEHVNYFSRDLLMSSSRVEIFIGKARCEEIIEVVRCFARETHTTAGILTVESIDRMVNLNTGEDVPGRDL